MDITNTISNPDFIPTDTNLVLIGIAIMIILSYMMNHVMIQMVTDYQLKIL